MNIAQQRHLLQSELAIGESTMSFLETQLGQFLMGCARQECEQAKEALRHANPRDWERIADLQRQAEIPEKFIAWIDEAISNGKAAGYRLNELNAAERSY